MGDKSITVDGDIVGPVSVGEKVIAIQNLGKKETNDATKGDIIAVLKNLQQAIISSKDLKEYTKDDVIKDLDHIATEISKEKNEQDRDSIKYYWGKVTNVVRNVDPLIAIAANLAALLGIK
jgi:hypothetical protein